MSWEVNMKKVLYMPNNMFSNSAFTEYTHPFDFFIYKPNALQWIKHPHHKL